MGASYQPPTRIPPLARACREGEFFGLYGLAGTFSAITGPVLYGVIVSTLLSASWGKGAYQMGILSFLILMLIGFGLLRSVPDRLSEPAIQ